MSTLADRVSGSRPVPGTVVRSPRDRLSVRFAGRSVVVGVLLLAGGLAAALVTLATGSASLPLAEVWASLTGNGTRGTDFVVFSLRLPRLLVGFLVGALLGIAGAIFQSISHNPLGSPDIIGFTAGSATGALWVIIIVGDGGALLTGGSVLGAVATAVVVYLLAFRRGMQGFRLVLVGIGVSTLLVSLNGFLLTRADLRLAEKAQRWYVGTLNGAEWGDVVVLGVVLAVLAPVLAGLGRPLALLEMGDDAAAARGVRVEPVRLGLVAAGVVLTGAAVAAAGPIAFVALAAPQLARRLTRASGPGLVTSALMGALVLMASDLAAERLLPERLPVGVTTAAVGGLYLAWLLAVQWHRGGQGGL